MIASMTGFGSGKFKQHGIEAGDPPQIDLAAEARLQRLLVEAARCRLLHSAHDTSEGGLAVALAESSFGPRRMGCRVDLVSDGIRTDFLLFAETQSRVIVSCPQRSISDLLDLARTHEVTAATIGSVTAGVFSIRVDGEAVLDADLEALKASWRNSFVRGVFGAKTGKGAVLSAE